MSKHIPLAIAFWCVAGIAMAQTTPQAAPEPVTVQVKNEAAVNTAGLEFSPTFFEDGIVFISTNTVGMQKDEDPELKMPKMSILRSRRTPEGDLGGPEPFARELTSVNHQGPVCFDRTAETVYFSSNVMENGKEITAKDGTVKMRLYASTKSGATWSAPVALPFNKGEWDDMHPAISIDGDKLFFSSNRPGGFGGMDLFVSYRVGNSWSEPVNLGANINGKGNEVFPFLHADNTLYFASDNMPGGKGGFDLYYVTPEGTQWTRPINMDAPFNTPGDDFGFIVDLNKINGYFSSNGHEGGKGGDEILSYHTENGNLDDFLLQNKRVPDRELDVQLLVVDRSNNQPVPGATVQILDENTTNVIGRDDAGNLIGLQKQNGQDVIRTMPAAQGVSGQTDARGAFTTTLHPGSYLAIITQKGFQTRQLRLPISRPGNKITVALERPGPIAGKTQWNAAVFNYVTNAPMVGTTVVLTNKATGKRDTVVTDAGGLADYYLDRNSRYQADMYQGGRLIGSSEITTSGNETMLSNISVAPLLPGTVIELPNIYYNFNDATLRPDARKDLDLVGALMRQHTGITVEITSHTDARGSENYNRQLSQRRAEGVVDYLVTRGIPRNRLTPVGQGESSPRNGCIDGVQCSESDHARNRRTEIRILTGMQGASVIYVDGQVAGSSPITGTAPAGTPTAPGKPVTGAAPAPGQVTVSSGEMEFHVIAGSFLMENRAHARAQELTSAGFTNTQVIQFPGSTFYSVSVGRFGRRSEASQLEKQLRAAKYETFIRNVPRS